MGSCLSKSGKKAKDNDDDRMPHSPSDTSKKGKYEVKEAPTAVTQKPGQGRTNPPQSSPPPPPAPERSPPRTLPTGDTAEAYASYPIKDASPPEPPIKGILKKSSDYKQPELITDVPSTTSKPAAVVNLSPGKDPSSPTRSSLAAAKTAQREMKSIPVATPTVPESFVTTDDTNVSEAAPVEYKVPVSPTRQPVAPPDTIKDTPISTFVAQKVSTEVSTFVTPVKKEVETNSEVLKAEIRTITTSTKEFSTEKLGTMVEKVDTKLDEVKRNNFPVTPNKDSETSQSPKNTSNTDSTTNRFLPPKDKIFPQVPADMFLPETIETKQTTFSTFKTSLNDGVEDQTRVTSYQIKSTVTKVEGQVDEIKKDAKEYIMNIKAINGLNNNTSTNGVLTEEQVQLEIDEAPVVEINKEVNIVSKEVKRSIPTPSPRSSVTPQGRSSGGSRFGFGGSPNASKQKRITGSISSAASSGEETSSAVTSPLPSPEVEPPMVHDVNVIITNNKAPTEAIDHQNVMNGDDINENKYNTLEVNSTINNMRLSVQTILYDGRRINNDLMSRHNFQKDTRKSLLQNIDTWFKGETNQSGICVVHGDAGFGKTCLASEIYNRHKDEVAAYHFIDYKCEEPKHNIPKYMIQSIALMLCDSIPNYIQELPKAKNLERILAQGNVKQLFYSLISAPLSSIECDNKLIVIDALDQCYPTEREELFEMLNAFQNEAPSWLRVLVFTRSVNPVLESLNNANMMQIKHNNESASDMKKILKEPLGTILDRISLDGGLNQLVKKSGGSFLYCDFLKSIILNEMQGQNIALRNVERMFPNGVSGIFETRFGKFKEKVEAMVGSSDYSSILGPTALSVGPLSEFYLSQIFGEAVLEVQEALQGLFPLVTHKENQYDLAHKVVWDLLFDEQSGDLMLDSRSAYEQLGSLCYGIYEGIPSSSHKDLDSFKCYAVKHMIRHLVNVPKQQEKVGKVLCNLGFIQTKLNIPGVSVDDLKEDYNHGHWKILPSGEKFVNLDAYMKKYPKVSEQISVYRNFINDTSDQLDSCPGDVVQIAANCSSIPTVQQDARAQLSKKPWLENITSVPDSPVITCSTDGTVCDADLSSDGKTLALITKDENYSLNLTLYHSQSGEMKAPVVDLKSLPDRVGLMVKFIPDGQNIFAGSLTTFVNTKGKTLNSGLDLASVNIKEKYSIECCDTSSKHLVCAQNTFPFGGRSVHLSVFDLKTKKCIKTLEVLKFRFGGNAQFGVKSCCLGKDKPLVAACIKQSHKQLLLVNIWSLTKWQLVSSVELTNDNITKSILTGDTMLFSASMRTASKTDSEDDVILTRTLRWAYKGKDKAPAIQDTNQIHGTIAANKTTVSQCSWSTIANNADLSVTVSTTSDQNKFLIRGQPVCSDLLCDNKTIITVSHESFSIYNIDDLEQTAEPSSEDTKTLSDIVALELLFLPKSDTLAVVASAGTDLISVKLWDARQEDISCLKNTPFLEENVHYSNRKSKSELFGSATTILMCSPDGNFLVLNNGSSINVWSRISDSVKTLPLFEEDQTSGNTRVWCAASTKDSILAVTTEQTLEIVDIYDLKTCAKVKQIDTQLEISDFYILPSQANVVTYHKSKGKLQVFSVRSGAAISSELCKLSLCRVSPALDRLALSVIISKDKGIVNLRNSDNKIKHTLQTPGDWHPNPNESDLQFSTDGTILIGTSTLWNECVIWNAGNGEILNSIAFHGTASIPGMMTNTHFVLQNDKITVTDVASGEMLARMPLGEGIERKPSPRSLCFCSRSNVMAMCDDKGLITVLIGHNINEAKRQTTLQRMKSFRK